MIDPLLTWQVQWDLLPIDPTGLLYPTNIATLLSNRMTSKLELTAPYIPSAPTVFTFALPIFATGITGIPISPTGATAAIAFANAFEAACAASTFVAAAGGSVGVPTPATIFSAPPVAVFNPASVTAAKSVLQTSLAAAVPTGLPLTSTYPIALYTAFATLQVTLTGINSVPPPAGPNPLTTSAPVI